MGLFVLYMLYRLGEVGAGWFEQGFLAVLFAVLWIVPVLLYRHWRSARRAASDERRGRLREGLFLGPEGVLVRLRRNQGSIIAWDRLRQVQRYRRRHAEIIQWQTLDGPVEFQADQLREPLANIQRAIQTTRPAGSEPTSTATAAREFRFDPQPQRLLLRFVCVFMGSGVLLVTSLAGVLMTADGTSVRDWWALGVFLAIISFFVSGAYGFYVLYRISAYECPSCGLRLPRVDSARPLVHFDCPQCNVCWTTKMSEQRLGMS